MYTFIGGFLLGSRWSEDEFKLLEELCGTMTYIQMESHFPGRTGRNLSRIAVAKGIAEPTKKSIWTVEEDILLSELYGLIPSSVMVFYFKHKTLNNVKTRVITLGLVGKGRSWSERSVVLSINGKVCTSCKKDLTLDNFCKSTKSLSGLSSLCRDCDSKRKSTREPATEGEKTCGCCGLTKHVTEFHVNKHGTLGRCSTCKDCSKVTGANYYKNNREKILIKCKAYVSSIDPVIKSEKASRYYQEHREKSLKNSRTRYLNNKEEINEYGRNWYAKNADRINLDRRTNKRAAGNEQSRKRRAATLQAIPSWYNQDYAKDPYLEAEYFQLTVDHIVPLIGKYLGERVSCGLHWEGNMQLLTKSENSSKGCHHWPDMWDYEAYHEETLTFLKQTKGKY